jgi:hypothetical protein
MWSFSVNIHQGTFSTSNKISDIRRYVKRIRKADYSVDAIGIRPLIWSLDECWVEHKKMWDMAENGHLSKEELLAKLRKDRKVFYKSRGECRRVMRKFVATARQVVREVYGL